MSEPSKSDWAALYEAAIEFQKASPWEWMDNEDLFAIENPTNAKVGYCTILGSGGEEFGLGIYMGDEGYDAYTRLITGKVDPEDFDEGIMTSLLSMLFVDREFLRKRDVEVIRSLGLRFRGRNAWPFFRSQWPGYVPWFLEKGETLFLTTAVKQALAVANRVRYGELDLIPEGGPDRVLTRYYRAGEWLEEWRKPKKAERRTQTGTEAMDPVNEAQVHLLHSRASQLSGSWELDIFALPMAVESALARPYFPICFMAVERKLGLIVDTSLTNPWLTLAEKQDAVIQILNKAHRLPHEIRVKSKKVRQVLEPITKALGIDVRVGSLRMLEQAKASIYDGLSRRNM